MGDNQQVEVIQVDQVEILDLSNSAGHSEADMTPVQTPKAQVTSAPSTVAHTPNPQLSGTEDPMFEVCPSTGTDNIESST